MPKAKPTQVIVHRIELQEKEREMLAPLIISKSVRNLMWPAVGASGVYVAYKVGYAAFGWAEDIFDGVRDKIAEVRAAPGITSDSFVNPFNNPGTAPDGEPTNIFGLPGWGIIPGIL